MSRRLLAIIAGVVIVFVVIAALLRLSSGGASNALATPWGDRVFDIEVTLKDGRVIYLETKAGGAGVDPMQQLKDNWLRGTGIISTVVREN